MFERILRPLVLSCLFAILVHGSTSIRPEDQTRSRRHASCPSCSRERPDALVSWYPEQVRRDYRGLQPEVDRWPRDRRYQADPPFYSLYDRAVGSGRAPTYDKLGDPRKREDPFSIQGDVNFDLAPAPTPSVRGLEPPSPDYQARYQVPRSMSVSSYPKPNFYNKISRQSDLMPSNRYSGYGSTPEEPSFEGFGPFNVFEDRNRKLYQDPAEIYTNYPFDNERPLPQPRHYPRRPVANIRAPVTPRTYEMENPFAPRRAESRDAQVMYTPQVARSSYSPPFDYKMAANAARDAEEVAQDNWRRQQVDEGWRDRGERIQEYEDRQRTKMAEQMNQADQQEEMKGKRGAGGENSGVEVIGKSKVSWSKLTKSSTDVGSPEVVDGDTEPPTPVEVTKKPA